MTAYVSASPAATGPVEWASVVSVRPAWLLPVGVVASLVVGTAIYHGRWATAELGWEGVPNAVTLFRGGLLAVLAAFLVVEPRSAWVPTALYGTAALLDQVDGRLARRFDAETDLGARLDAEFDAIGFAVGPLVAATVGGGPVWFAALGLVRVPYVVHLGLRRRRGLRVGDLSPSRLRRPLAGAAMVVTTLLLAPPVGPGVGRVLAAAVAVPFLLRYAIDWLTVVGRRPATAGPSDVLTEAGERR